MKGYMKFKVKEEYCLINNDIVINSKNSEIGILKQYIDIKGNYREIIDRSFQINSSTNTVQGWKERYEELFDEDTQTGTKNEKYPVGTNWHDQSRLGWYVVEAIIHIYNEKLYVISDGGHWSGLFGVNSKDIDNVMKKLEYNIK
jgi:hypothetical protein